MLRRSTQASRRRLRQVHGQAVQTRFTVRGDGDEKRLPGAGGQLEYCGRLADAIGGATALATQDMMMQSRLDPRIEPTMTGVADLSRSRSLLLAMLSLDGYNAKGRACSI